MKTDRVEMLNEISEIADRIVMDDNFEFPPPINSFIGENIRSATQVINTLFSEIDQSLKSSGVSDKIIDDAFSKIAVRRRRTIHDLLRLAGELQNARIVAPVS